MRKDSRETIPENWNLKNDDKEICRKSNGAYEARQSLRRKSYGNKSLKGPFKRSPIIKLRD